MITFPKRTADHVTLLLKVLEKLLLITLLSTARPGSYITYHNPNSMLQPRIK